MKYNLSEETKKNINYVFKEKLGITYDEFDKLEIEEQRELLKEHKKNNKKTEYVDFMIGSGEHSTFIKVKRGEIVMLSDGTFVRAGSSPEEEMNKIDKKINKIIKEPINKKILSLFKKK